MTERLTNEQALSPREKGRADKGAKPAGTNGGTARKSRDQARAQIMAAASRSRDDNENNHSTDVFVRGRVGAGWALDVGNRRREKSKRQLA